MAMRVEPVALLVIATMIGSLNDPHMRYPL